MLQFFAALGHLFPSQLGKLPGPKWSLAIWACGYLAPAAVGFLIVARRKLGVRELLVIHLALAYSIAFLLVSGARLPVGIDAFQVVICLLACTIALFLLGNIGLLYIVSSIVQQCCLLLSNAALVAVLGLLPSALICGAIYAAYHLLDFTFWREKLVVTLIWGISSALIYGVFHRPLINISLHIIGGSILIYGGFLLRGVLNDTEQKRMDSIQTS